MDRDLSSRCVREATPEEREAENQEHHGTVIKISPSDIEYSESDDDDGGGFPPEPDPRIKLEIEDSDDDEDLSDNDRLGNNDSCGSPETGGDSSSDEEDNSKRAAKEKEGKRGIKRGGDPLGDNVSARGRTRPKQPRRLSDQVEDGYTSEDNGPEVKPVLQPGGSYPVEFKLKVLNYAETHSNAAAAEKFGIQAKRIREWKLSKDRFEEQKSGNLTRRPRSDGFTVEQKLKAVALADERSIEEARLVYNIDRSTMIRWRRRKAEFEARLLRGEVNAIRQAGAGRKPTLSTEIEEKVRDWIISMKQSDVPVSQKMVLNKVQELMDEDPSMQDAVRPKTWCWYNGFLKRHNLRPSVTDGPNPEDQQQELSNSELDSSSIIDSILNQDKAVQSKGGQKRTKSNAQVKVDLQGGDDNNDDGNHHSDDNNLSPASKPSSDDENDKKTPTKPKSKLTKKPVARKRTPKTKGSRGRPKLPDRLNAPDDYTSEDEEGCEVPVYRQGSGYPLEFKLRVLKYAEFHSSSATAQKFGLKPKRVREWKSAKSRIEEESKGSLKRRPRSDGFTVEEKLQAVEFANERSIDEARLLYNVDRNTIGKWKAKKAQFEARVSRGEGNFIREMGCGRKPKYTPIEDSLREWIVAVRLRGITLNYRMILNKAKKLIEADPSLQDLPLPRTWSWVIGFLRRHNIQGLLGNTLGREDPRELLNSEMNSGDVMKLAEKIDEIPENPNKRNRRTISLEDKVNIIRRIEAGETQGTVAKSLNVATSTIQTIWSCRNEILHKYTNPKAKAKSDALVWKIYSSIGYALADWLDQNCSKTLKVTSVALMEKAIQFSETYKLPQFHSEAKQWLKIFCRKHKLLDVLAEMKEGVVAGTSCPPALIDPYTGYINSMDSSDHHDDNFLEEFNINDYVSPKNEDPPNQSIQSTSRSHQTASIVPPHQAFSTENLIQQRSSMLFGTQKPAISTAEAIKCYSLLKNWIESNYGPHDSILSANLAGLESTVLKRQTTETGYASNNYL